MNDYQFDPITGQLIPKDGTPDIKQTAPQEVPAAPVMPEVPAEPAKPEMPAAPIAPEVPIVPEAPAAPPTPEVPVPEPEQPAVEPAAQEIPFSAPTPEQPIYRYVPTQPQEPAYAPEPPKAEPPHYQPQPPKKEKKPAKPLTRGALISILAITLVLAIGLGFAGGFFAENLFGKKEPEQLNIENVTNDPDTVVIYKTAKLVDEEGEDVKEPLTVEEVAELVGNSVVEITTEQIVSGSFFQQYVSEGAGSGVIFTTDGYIVTNNHVIDGATNIKVRLKDGTTYEAELIGTDAKTDLAVIKIEATGLTPAAFGDSKQLKVGEEVVAVGNPLGQLGGTVTRGIISALDREIDIDNTTMSLLQTDTAINPGNSGGGLFNTSGQLVGIVNAKSAGEEIEGLGFAIPINTADTVINDLLSHGYVKGRVNVGIVYLAIQDNMSAMMYGVNELGLYVYSVEKGSDAERAGLRSGDLVVSIDGKTVASAANANAAFDAKKVGDTVAVVVKRGGKETTVDLKLTEYVPKGDQSTQTNNQVTFPTL